MKSDKIIWVIDDHKLRREGTMGFLASWAIENNILLKQIERPEHIYPDELVKGKYELSQICLMGIGGRSLMDQSVELPIRNAMTVLGDRPLAVILDDIDDTEIKHALKLGVRGLISTYLDSEVAFLAITFLMAGGSYFPHLPTVEAMNTRTDNARRVLASQLSAEPVPTSVESENSGRAARSISDIEELPQTLPELSDRQADVLEALKLGYSNKMIARELNLSEATVKIHMRTLIQKFGAANRTQVALMAADPALTTKRKSPRTDRPSDGPQRKITH